MTLEELESQLRKPRRQQTRLFALQKRHSPLARHDLYADIYEPLPKSGRWIRVLKVKQSSLEAECKLVIDLSVVDIDDPKTDYDALSYVWGNPVSSPECELGYSDAHNVRAAVISAGTKRIVSITRNLYEALVNLWALDHRRALWVDALCINQEDPSEKPGQLGLMGEIYSNADEVIMWLGVDDIETPTFEDVFWLHTTILDRVDKYEEDHGPLSLEDLSTTSCDDAVSFHRVDITIPLDSLRALYRFYGTRRYLSRAWVRQELILAGKDPKVLLGDKVFSFDRLIRLRAAFCEHPIVRQMAQPFIAYSEGGGFGDELLWIAQIRARLGSHEKDSISEYDKLTDKLFGVDLALPSCVYAIWELLLTTVHRTHASDPRDLIYSLMGVVAACSGEPGRKIGIEPRFDAPVEQVYLEFTTGVLQNSPHRHILSLACHNEFRQIEDDFSFRARLPTWVPDYTSCGRNLAPLQVTYLIETNEIPNFRPARGIQVSNRALEINGEDLSLDGFCAGRIALVRKAMPVTTETNSQSPESSQSIGESCTLLVSLLQMCIDLGPEHPTGYSCHEALVRLFAHYSYTDGRMQPLEDRVKRNIFITCSSTLARGSNDESMMHDSENLKNCVVLLQGQWGIPSLSEYERYEEIGRVGALPDGKAQLFERYTKDELMKVTDKGGRPMIWQDVHHTWVFNTAEGYTGRMEGVPKIGDEVWLFSEVNVPIVLRRLASGQYHLIGEAFVVGGMHGELVERGLTSELRRVTIV